MTSLSRFLDRLGERSRPHYGQLVLWTVLLCSWCLCVYFEACWGEKRTSDVRTTSPTSLLSFLPADLLLNRNVIVVCGQLFAAGAALWAARLLVPWSSWLTALSFNAVVVLYLENSSQETHVAHVAGGFLLIYALWYHFYRREIREADREQRFWRTALYPRWVYSLSVFYLGLFYGLSGFNKLAVSGLSWPNGVSLQLWVELFGLKDSVFTRLILSNRTAATAMQWAALIGECGGLVAIVSARLRPLVGLLLIGFHVAQICVFGWGFHTNMAMLALVFLPAYQWTPRVVAALFPFSRDPKGSAGRRAPLRVAAKRDLAPVSLCRELPIAVAGDSGSAAGNPRGGGRGAADAIESPRRFIVSPEPFRRTESFRFPATKEP